MSASVVQSARFVCGLMLIKSYFSHLICMLDQKYADQNKIAYFTQQVRKVEIFSVNSTQ